MPQHQKPEVLLTKEELAKLLTMLDKSQELGMGTQMLSIDYATGPRKVLIKRNEGKGFVVTASAGRHEGVRSYEYRDLEDLKGAHAGIDVLLYDDGTYFIEANGSYTDEQRANVFLCLRCMPDLHTPGGFTCIGGADQRGGNNWRADLMDVPTEDTDCTTVYDGESRNAAIAELWARRQQAYVGQGVRV